MDKLNLTPQERRLVAGVGLIVFIFLNIWLVWPHFSDWSKIQKDRFTAEQTLARYQKEVNRLKAYEAKVRDLENQGSRVQAEEQDIDLANVVRSLEQASKLEITDNRDWRSSNTQTNQFFDEKARKVQYRGDTETLVTFLTSLTQSDLLIRVKDLTVRTDSQNAPTRLIGDITLVASYQKKAPVKPASVAASAPTQTPPATQASKSATTTTRSNAIAKQVPAYKPSAGPNVATNRALSAAGTNKAPVPRPKPLLPSSPKS